MEFIFSYLLWLLPLSTIPLIFHLLNSRKFKVIDFSSIAFIKLLKTKSIRRMNIVNILLLILRMLIILFLILTISRPVLKSSSGLSGDSSSKVLVVIIDDTFSNMNSYDPVRNDVLVSFIDDIVQYYDPKVHVEILSATKNLLYSGAIENFRLEDLSIEFTNKTANLSKVLPIYFDEKFKRKYLNGDMFIITDMDESFFESPLPKEDWWDVNIINTSENRRPLLISHMNIVNDVILPSEPFQIDLEIYNPSNYSVDSVQAYIELDNAIQVSKNFNLLPNETKNILITSLIEERGAFNLIGGLKDQDSFRAGNRYHLKSTVMPKLEICLCDFDSTLTKYIKTAIYAISDSDIFLIENCSFYYEDLYNYKVVFIDNVNLLEKEGFVRYINNGGHVVVFPKSSKKESLQLTEPEYIYIQKDNIANDKVLTDVFNDFDSDTVIISSNKYIRPVSNESIIVTDKGSLWDRKYVEKGLIDLIQIPLDLSESDFIIRAPFVPFIHFLILSHYHKNLDNLFIGESFDFLSRLDIEDDNLILLKEGLEISRFKSFKEMSFDKIESPGTYFITSNNDTVVSFSANISNLELTFQRNPEYLLSQKFSNLTIIDNPSSIKKTLEEKLRDLEIWYVFLFISIIFIIFETILINVYSRK